MKSRMSCLSFKKRLHGRQTAGSEARAAPLSRFRRTFSAWSGPTGPHCLDSATLTLLGLLWS